jgi:hypothetical protein
METQVHALGRDQLDGRGCDELICAHLEGSCVLEHIFTRYAATWPGAFYSREINSFVSG